MKTEGASKAKYRYGLTGVLDAKYAKDDIRAVKTQVQIICNHQYNRIGHRDSSPNQKLTQTHHNRTKGRR